MSDATRTAVLAFLWWACVATAAPLPRPTEAARPAPRLRAVVRLDDDIPSRFIEPDSNRPVRCFVDASVRPSGVTLSQALGAVSNALQAWTAVSSALFSIEGVGAFGTGAENMTGVDGTLWIQLHNTFGTITNATMLGLNGRSAYDDPAFPSGGIGGRIGTREFNQTAWSFIAIAHTNPAVRNPITLAEVLCHEAGHALGLDHSSQNAAEPNPVLKEAVMFFQNHGDGRGAALTAWDIAAVQGFHPTNNTPPCTVPRALEAVTATPQPSGTLGVNEYEMPGFDRQGTALTPILTNATANNGNFVLVGSRLRYIPNLMYADQLGFFDYCFVRLSDGVNRSPPALYSIVAFSRDSHPRDGMPDAWRNRYWPMGNSGAASSDFDGDGFSNIQEWINGTDPTNRSSYLRIAEAGDGSIGWRARTNGVYQVLATTAIGGRFTPAMLPVSTPTGGTGQATVPVGVSPRFFRIKLAP